MKKRFFKVLGAMCVVAMGLIAMNCAVYGEGSLELNNTDSGYRTYMEYSTATATGGISRETELKVFAKVGETICLGSSGQDTYYTDTNGNKVAAIVTNPSGAITNIPMDTINKVGLIESRTQERAGANFDGNNVSGYIPYKITVKQTGLYKISFPGLNDNGVPAAIDVNNETFTSASSARGSGACVAAWDISVYNSKNEYVKGRVFANSLALNSGGGGNHKTDGSVNKTYAVYPKVHILTADGYDYEVNLNGMDPYGFIIYSNNRGIVDNTTHTTWYRNATISGSKLIGNLFAPTPTLEDEGKNITHKIFFNTPADDLPASIPTKPQPSATFNVNSIESNYKQAEDKTTYESVGLTAKVDFSKVCTYTMVIDVDGDGQYDPEKDGIVRDAASKGVNTIVWNGKNAKGEIVKVNDTKDGKLGLIFYIKSGEAHIPLMDVEYNANGIKVELKNLSDKYKNVNVNSAYFNDTTSNTANGTEISLDGVTGTARYEDLGLKYPSGYYDTGGEKGAAPYTTKGTTTIDSEGNTTTTYSAYGNDKVIDVWTEVRGYQNEDEANADTSRPTDISPTIVPSDGAKSYVYYTDSISILPTDYSFGKFNGYVFLDDSSNKNGTVDQEDVAFPEDVKIYAEANVNGSAVKEVYTAIANDGKFSIPFDYLKDGANAGGTLTVWVLYNSESYTASKLTTATNATIKSESVYVDENYNVVDSGTEMKAIKYVLDISGITSDTQYYDFGLVATKNPDGSVGIETDDSLYAITDGKNNYVTNIITVTNNDTSLSLKNVKIYVPVLENHIYYSGTFLDSDGNEITDGSAGNYENETGYWTIGDLAAGKTYKLKIISKVNTAGDYVADATLTADNDGDTSNNNSYVDYDVRNALFKFIEASRTKGTDGKVGNDDTNNTTDDNVIVVGQLTGENDADYANVLNNVGFLITKDASLFKVRNSEFSTGTGVFYQEITDMGNKIYDTEDITEETSNRDESTAIYISNDENKYYGATVFEGLLSELSNDIPYYVQGCCQYDSENEIVREEHIWKLTLNADGSIGYEDVYTNDMYPDENSGGVDENEGTL